MSSESKVYIAESNITGAGRGLFASQFLQKGDTICFYDGSLVHSEIVKYMDPTYVVEWETGRNGRKLVGEISNGHFGSIANSRSPSTQSLVINAKYAFGQRRSYENDSRGLFPLVALIEIERNEEIIVNYGVGYWKTFEKYVKNGLPEVPKSSVDRDKRASNRDAIRMSSAYL
jgi:hypothetical protein